MNNNTAGDKKPKDWFPVYLRNKVIYAENFKGFNLPELKAVCPDIYQRDDDVHAIYIKGLGKTWRLAIGDFILKIGIDFCACPEAIFSELFTYAEFPDRTSNKLDTVLPEEGWYMHTESKAYYYVTGLITVQGWDGNWKEMVEYQNKSSEKSYARFPEKFKNSFVKVDQPDISPDTNKTTLENAPIGTKAPAIMGGYWIRVVNGWKWWNGNTFPRPGGDWTGELILPMPSPEPARLTAEVILKKSFLNPLEGAQKKHAIAAMEEYAAQETAEKDTLLQQKHREISHLTMEVHRRDLDIDLLTGDKELLQAQLLQKEKQITTLQYHFSEAIRILDMYAAPLMNAFNTHVKWTDEDLKNMKA
jgi:hypothetical protein